MTTRATTLALLAAAVAADQLLDQPIDRFINAGGQDLGESLVVGGIEDLAIDAREALVALIAALKREGGGA